MHYRKVNSKKYNEFGQKLKSIQNNLNDLVSKYEEMEMPTLHNYTKEDLMPSTEELIERVDRACERSDKQLSFISKLLWKC